MLSVFFKFIRFFLHSLNYQCGLMPGAKGN